MTWTPERHAAARKACEAATSGPWSASVPVSYGVEFILSENQWIIGDDAPAKPDDADFIVTARTELPAALDEIERLQAAVAAAYKRGQEAMRDRAATEAWRRMGDLGAAFDDRSIVECRVRSIPIREEGAC